MGAWVPTACIHLTMRVTQGHFSTYETHAFQASIVSLKRTTEPAFYLRCVQYKQYFYYIQYQPLSSIRQLHILKLLKRTSFSLISLHITDIIISSMHHCVFIVWFLRDYHSYKKIKRNWEHNRKCRTTLTRHQQKLRDSGSLIEICKAPSSQRTALNQTAPNYARLLTIMLICYLGPADAFEPRNHSKSNWKTLWHPNYQTLQLSGRYQGRSVCVKSKR